MRKIISFIILAAFLFTNTAYSAPISPVYKLRVPLSTTASRQEKIQKRFSIHNYRPGWTFKGWGEAKEAIKERFKTTKERREALRYVRALAMKLAENKMWPTVLWLGIPEAAKTAKNIDELKLFMELGIKLTENKIDPEGALRYTIPAISRLANDAGELKSICDSILKLSIELIIEDKRSYLSIFEETIPSVVRLTSNMHELNNVCGWLSTLSKKIPDEFYHPLVLESAVPEAAKAAKDIDELKLFMDLGIKLAEKGKNPSYALSYAIPAVAELTRNITELKETCDYLFDLNVNIAYFSPAVDGDALLTHPLSPLKFSKAVKVAKNIDDLKLFIDSGIKILKSGGLAYDVFGYFIPAAAATARDREELKLFMDLVIKISENVEHPHFFSSFGDIIISIDKAAKDRDELKLFIDLGIKLAENKINPYRTLKFDIPAVARVAKNIGDLKDICDYLFILTRKLDRKPDVSYILENEIPSLAREAKNIADLETKIGSFLEERSIAFDIKALKQIREKQRNL